MQLKWPMLWDLFSLFPAHAGVIPNIEQVQKWLEAFPRTRGGDPSPVSSLNAANLFSPHTRG